MSKKIREYKRYEEARLKIAKFHAKFQNTRTDFMHQLSTEIINYNHRGTFLKDLSESHMVLENLNVSSMVKNPKLSRAISDFDWRYIGTLLEGKAEKYCRVLRVINRWKPTYQKFSCFGFEGGKLDLSVRESKCLNCGTKHDHDRETTKNILVAGG